MQRNSFAFSEPWYGCYVVVERILLRDYGAAFAARGGCKPLRTSKTAAPLVPCGALWMTDEVRRRHPHECRRVSGREKIAY